MTDKPKPTREQLLAFLKINTPKIASYERELEHRARHRESRGVYGNREHTVSVASR